MAEGFIKAIQLYMVCVCVYVCIFWFNNEKYKLH